MSQQITVALGHPAVLIRDVAERALADDFDLVAVCNSMTTLIDECERLRPAVVLSASCYDDGQLIDAVGRLLRVSAAVLVLGERKEHDTAAALLLAGASGYILTDDATVGTLGDAIRTLSQGQASLHPAAAAAVLAQWRLTRSTAPGDHPRRDGVALTARETEVLGYFGLGLTAQALARQLGISAKTVESHKTRIFDKLGARNQSHAVALARTAGIIGKDVVSLTTGSAPDAASGSAP